MRPLTSKISFRNFCLLIFSLTCITLVLRSGHSAASSNGAEVLTDQALPLQTSVSVHASQRGRPWINLADGHQLQSSYKGAAKTAMLSGSGVQPRSLASADFNGDGFADLIVGYSSADGGSLALHRLNPEALAPKLLENQEAIAKLNYPAPFLSDTNTVRTPIAADFIGTGDFNGDSLADIVVAARDRNELVFFAGDGRGNFKDAESVMLPGQVTALLAQSIGLWKGNTDLMVAVNSGGASQLLVYSDATGAWGAEPASYALPAAGSAIAAGVIDNRTNPDIVVAAGQQLIVVPSPTGAAGAGASERVDLPYVANSVQLGDFVWDRENRNEIAVLGNEGTIHLLSNGQLDRRPYSHAEIQLMLHNRPRPGDEASLKQFKALKKTLINRSANVTGWTDASTLQTSSGAAQLIATTMSNGVTDELLALDRTNNKIDVVLGVQNDTLQKFAKSAARPATVDERPETVSLDTDSAPVAVLPMKLNVGTRTGMVVLQQNQLEASPIITPAAVTIDVDRTDDSVAAAASVCTAALNNCTLRAATKISNATAGPNQINVPAGTYTLTLPANNGAVNAPFVNTTYDDEWLFCNGFFENGGDLDLANQDVTIVGTGNPIIQAGTTATTAITNFTPPAGTDVVRNGNGIDRVFEVNDCGSPSGNPINVALNGVTIRNGYAPEVPLSGGNFFESGGGVLFDGTNWNTNATTNKTLTLTNTTVTANFCASQGGGVAVYSGALATSGSTISTNVAYHAQGGGIAYIGALNGIAGQTAVINSTTISGNTVSFNPEPPGNAVNAADGGGMYVSAGNGLTIGTTSHFDNNIAHLRGGGLMIISVSPTITGGTISGNTSRSEGGGLWSQAGIVPAVGTISLSGVTVSGNTAQNTNGNGNGGGIFNRFGNMTITGTSHIDGNVAFLNGGGIFSTWSGNAGQNSAGLTINSSSTVGQTGSGNTARNNGGGVAISGNTGAPAFGNITFTSITFQANTANSDSSGGGDGGGIFIDSGTLNSFNACTIDNNVANSGNGDGMTQTGGTVTGAGAINFINGDSLAITGGTFISTPGIMSITGNFIHSGGVFTHNSGTVTFNGTGAQAVNGLTTFNNLTINNTFGAPDDSNDVDTDSADTVATTLTVTDGQFQPATGSSFKDVTIAAAGIFKADSGATCNVSGNFSNSGTFTANSGTINFNGSSGTQTISGNNTFFNLTENNAGATLAYGATLTTIGNTLTKSAGTMDPGTGTITFTGGAGTMAGNSPKIFFNLVINPGASISQAASTGDITINNNYTNDGTFTQNSGLTTTFAGTNTTHTLTGAGTSTFGIFTVTVGHTVNVTHTMNVSGSALNANGTFNATSGTVAFSGAAQSLAGAGTKTFNNLTINSGSTTTTSGSSPTVSALLTVGGTFTTASTFNNVTINSGGILNGTNATTMNVSGNFLNSGTFNGTGNTVNFNGAAAQSVGGTGTSNFSNLTDANTLAGGNGITLAGNINVAGVLALGANNIDTSTFTLTMPASGTSTGTGDVIGNVKRTGLILNTTFSFGNPFNTIKIESGAVPTDINMNLVKAAPADYPLAVQRKYVITPNGANGPVTLRLHYLDTELNGNDENTMIFRRFNGAGWTPVTPTSRDTGANWLEKTGQPQLSPWTFSSSGVPTATSGTISGRITDTNGVPVAGAVVNLSGTQNRKMITDANGNYSFAEVETTGFYTVRATRANYTFSPQERSFSQLGNQTEATFTATASAATSNPVDTAEYFVRQHYLDFLGREPEESGFNFWSDQILGCGSDAGCAEVKRINVSAAYFLSIEFQETGGLVDGLYRASFARAPNYAEFMPDSATIGKDVIVGRAGWQQQLSTNRQAFLDAFVQRPAFQSVYGAYSNEQYVEQLLTHTRIIWTQAEREALVNGLASGTQTRAAVLGQIAGDQRFVTAKQNQMFVMMEYFGYLRRDPDAAGYEFWLNKLNQFNGNFEQAEMVKAFIVSAEYRQRFPL